MNTNKPILRVIDGKVHQWRYGQWIPTEAVNLKPLILVALATIIIMIVLASLVLVYNAGSDSTTPIVYPTPTPLTP